MNETKPHCECQLQLERLDLAILDLRGLVLELLAATDRRRLPSIPPVTCDTCGEPIALRGPVQVFPSLDARDGSVRTAIECGQCFRPIAAAARWLFEPQEERS